MTIQVARTLAGKLVVLGRPQITDPGIIVRDFIGEISAYTTGGTVTPPGFIVGTTQPDATNTGRPAGRPSLTTKSTASNGDYVMSSGEVLQDALILGHLIFPSGCTNATARYCEIRGKANISAANSGEGLVLIQGGSGNTVDQCDIAQTSATQTWFVNGVKMTGGSATVSRCDVHDVLDTFYITGGTIQALGNFQHDFMLRTDDSNQGSGTPANWSHNDGYQIRGGANHVIRGNYIRGTFSYVTGMASTANPTDAPPFLWRNHHLMLVQGIALITNLQIVENWFAYGSIGIQFANNGSTAGNTATMSGNRIAPNQAVEFSQTRQFLVDAGQFTVNGIGTTTWMDHPDTPPAIVGLRLDATPGMYQTGTPTSGGWAYKHNVLTPSPNGADKPFI